MGMFTIAVLLVLKSYETLFKYVSVSGPLGTPLGKKRLATACHCICKSKVVVSESGYTMEENADDA